MLVSILTIHFQLEVHFFIKAIIRFGILYDVVSCILSADFAACLLSFRHLAICIYMYIAGY